MNFNEHDNDEGSYGDGGDFWEEYGEEESDDDDDSSGNENDVDLGSVKKFIRNVHNGDYDQEFDNALSSDRSITPSDRPTQASYNKLENWVQRNRIGLEKVMQQLLTCIDSMKSDTSFNLELNHISIGRNQRLMNNEEPIVWHEPIVDRYWDVLEAEIDQRKQLDNVTTDIKHLQIMNIEMKEERLAALVAILRSGRATNSSTFVNFDNVNLCDEGIVSLSKMVEVSSKLECFCIHRNQIDNMESARCLSRSLLSHTCIYHLVLKHCDLGSSPEILSIILQSDMRLINLENNNIDSLGAVKIAEYLEGDQSLRSINLAHNRLNDEDAILISQALNKNKYLHIITLHTNNLTFIGVKALLNCVFDGSEEEQFELLQWSH
jgi:hypothetical protein